MAKKIRAFFWLIQGVFKKYLRLIIFSLVLGIGGFFLVSLLTPYLQKILVPRRIGLIGHYTLANLPEEISRLLSAGLTVISEDGQPVAYLTDNWQLSDDEKTYVFKLKDGLSWQSGQPLKATEINFQLKDVNISVLDERTIEFKLQEPFSPLPSLLAQPIFKKGLLGLGPYKVLKVRTNGQLLESISLKSEDNSLIYRFYPTEAAAKTALKLGKINQLKSYFSCEVEPDWQPYLQVDKTLATDQFVALFYNTADPNLASKNLRQALTYAVKDKPQDSSRALGPISPASWASNPQVKRYDFDPEAAQELFKKFEAEGGELAEGEEKTETASESVQPELKLTISTVPSFLDLAEKIQQSWKEVLGLEVEVKTINSLSQDFEILLVAQEIPADPDQYSLWHSTQGTNITRLNSPKIDKLLEDGRKISGLKERKEIYLDFQRFLLEECPAAFLFHPYSCTISRN